jgi:hypothetical protein
MLAILATQVVRKEPLHMPTYVAFGKDFGITLDAEPDEVTEKLASIPSGHFTEFQGTQKSGGQRYLLNGGGVCYVVRIGAGEEPSNPPPSQPSR